MVTCCASGYPEPMISINGNFVKVNCGKHTDGVYTGCASRNITTSNLTAGASLVTYCNVSLTQRVNCTSIGSSSTRVPPQVVKNCSAALSATVSASNTTLIAGKVNTVLETSMSD